MRHETTGEDTTDTTRRDTTEYDAAPTVVLTVADAAESLGISPGAVRKRIERGHLAGRKVNGQWQVILGATDATGHDATGRTQTDTTRRDPSPAVVSDAARSQLAAIRDEFVAPLVDRIGTLERETGRLEAERDALRAEVARLTAAHDAASAAQNRLGATDLPNAAPDTSWRRWWRWLTGVA